ncbi:hypothetical protein BJY00DRAFT_306747 [Aspergillus carlsbadensis]|nr:hypothetical protein BJY00DRAFT_306747 [Aspergillus carlsbadensis]
MGTQTTLQKFSAPGHLQDLSPSNQIAWSEQQISQWLDDEIAGNGLGRTPLRQFFNRRRTPYDKSQPGVAITWSAFPKRQVSRTHSRDDQRWAAADSSRDLQDEYLEWSVARDGTDPATSKVKRVVMTCEGPEYWRFLADNQPRDLVRLYKELNPDHGSQIAEQRLFTSNAMPPGQQAYNNTLGAEIDIAAQATVLRKDRNNKLITSPGPLIRCSEYGDPDRHSDPHIGTAINDLARQKHVIFIADPVGLYIHSFQGSVFKLDYHGSEGDEQDLRDLPAGTITWPRDDISQQQGLSLRIQVPDGVLGNRQQQLAFADYILMGVTGVVTNDTVTVDPQPWISTSRASALNSVKGR